MTGTTGVTVLEPRSQQLRLSVAGHPLPILAQPHQPAALLNLPIDVPIGVRAERDRRTSTVDLPPGSLLCLYTDGLVERRDSTLDAGLERLRGSVTAGSPESVCSTVMNTLIGTTVPDDDVALLTARHIHPSPR